MRFYTLQRRYAEAIRVLQTVLAAPEKLATAFGDLAPNYRAELAIANALAGNPDAQRELERAQPEMAAIRARGNDTNWTATVLLLLAGFQHDKETVDKISGELKSRIQSDAFTAAELKTAIAAARARLGETGAPLQTLEELLKTPGGNCLTPALLRIDPAWDPLRSDPRFQGLAETKL